jgi:hypothetical protein
MANELVTDDVVDDEAVADDTITDAMLRESAALTVIGRSANSTGNPADIAAVAASGAVLREAGSVLGFGTIATAGLADTAVTSAKLRDSAAVSVIGRSANSSGVPADIAAGSNLQYFGRRSNALGFFGLTEDDLSEVVATTSLGGDAQTISITVAGNTDEGLVLVGSGLCAAGTMTLGVNNEATAPTYGGYSSSNGGNPTGFATGLHVTNAGPTNFTIELDARVHDGSFRTGRCHAINNNNSTARVLETAMVIWANSTDEITTLILKGSVATFFKSGFKVKTRRRKVT